MDSRQRRYERVRATLCRRRIADRPTQAQVPGTRLPSAPREWPPHELPARRKPQCDIRALRYAGQDRDLHIRRRERCREGRQVRYVDPQCIAPVGRSAGDLGGLMGLKQLKAPQRRHLISMMPAIASAADLKSSARHDAHLFETQAESFDECMDALHKPATRMRGCGTASRPTVSWRGSVSSVSGLVHRQPPLPAPIGAKVRRETH